MFYRWHQDPPNTPSLLRCHQQALNKNQCEKSQDSSFPLISPTLMGSLLPVKDQNFHPVSSFEASNGRNVIDLVGELNDENGLGNDSLQRERHSDDENNTFLSSQKHSNKFAETFQGDTSLHSVKNNSLNFVASFGQQFYEEVKRNYSCTHSHDSLNCNSQTELFSSNEKSKPKSNSKIPIHNSNDVVLESPNVDPSKSIYFNLSGSIVAKEEIENIFSPLHSKRLPDKSTSAQFNTNSSKKYFSTHHFENTSLPCHSFISKGSMKSKSCRIFDSPHSSEAESPTKRLLERFLDNHSRDDIIATPKSGNSTSSTQLSSRYEFVWAKVSQNEYRLAEIVDMNEKSNGKVSVIFAGSKQSISIKRQDFIISLHSIGDLVKINGGHYGIINQVFYGSKSFEIFILDHENDIEIFRCKGLDEFSKGKECKIFYAEQLYLDNLLFKKRQNILLFSQYHFIVTCGGDFDAATKKKIEFLIKDNGGGLNNLKDNQLVTSQLQSKNTILLSSNPKRTIKYIYAICQDIVRLKIDWLYESLKIGEVLPYSRFLLPNNPTEPHPVPPKLNKKLFYKQSFCVKGSHSFKITWQTIIQSLGGIAVLRPPILCISQTSCDSAIGSKQENITVIAESKSKGDSNLQMLIKCIIDQSNYFCKGNTVVEKLGFS